MTWLDNISSCADMNIEIPKSIFISFELRDILSVKLPNKKQKENESSIIQGQITDKNRTRLAKNDNDFKKVFAQQFLDIDTIEITPTYRNEVKLLLIEQVNSLIKSYIENTEPNKRERDLQLLECARKFIAFLNNIERTERIFIIKTNVDLKKVFDICSEIFDCEYEIFQECIFTAKFQKLNIQKQNIAQDLTYRLSGVMDYEWYGNVCKERNWEKSVCSGQGQKLENHPIIKKLNKILPRPSKKTKFQ